MADESRGLVSEAARDGRAPERSGCQSPVGGPVGRAHDLGKMDLSAVEEEEVEDPVVVVERVQAYKHSAGCVYRVRNEDVSLVRPAVEPEDELRVYGPEGEVARVVGLLDPGDVLEQLQEFRHGWVGGQGQAAQRRKLRGAESSL